MAPLTAQWDVRGVLLSRALPSITSSVLPGPCVDGAADEEGVAAGVPSATAAAAAAVTATAALVPAAAAAAGAGARDEADAMGLRRKALLLLLLLSLFASPGCASNALTWRSTTLGGCRGSCRGCSPRLWVRRRFARRGGMMRRFAVRGKYEYLSWRLRQHVLSCTIPGRCHGQSRGKPRFFRDSGGAGSLGFELQRPLLSLTMPRRTRCCFRLHIAQHPALTALPRIPAAG